MEESSKSRAISDNEGMRRSLHPSSFIPLSADRPMSSKLLHDVRRFLMALEKVQEELGELFTHKRQALLHADSEAMARLTEAEAKTGERMQALLRFRAQLLNAAHGEGHAVESLA